MRDIEVKRYESPPHWWDSMCLACGAQEWVDGEPPDVEIFLVTLPLPHHGPLEIKLCKPHLAQLSRKGAELIQ